MPIAADHDWSSITARKALYFRLFTPPSPWPRNNRDPTKRFIMNDKVTPMATAPVSNPSDENKAGTQTAPAKKVEESKVEPAAKS